MGACSKDGVKICYRKFRQLQKDKHHYRRTVRILLLGSGESGKSTFLKQMRIINGGDFVEQELRVRRTVPLFWVFAGRHFTSCDRH